FLGECSSEFYTQACPTNSHDNLHNRRCYLDIDPCVLEKQELQRPTYIPLCYINLFMHQHLNTW
uniref:Uncharacterized protein n=1 Tax=Callorhinchus milii TaxID=7868 RepID=A0A4W3HX81_CALMI